MSATEGIKLLLFCYGTLQQREVQLALFGRELDGRTDVLPGYASSILEITDPDVIAISGSARYSLVRPTGNLHDEVPGMVFQITEAELAAADAYEVSDVKRVTARLGSGVDAFVYVDARS